jgi:hypothetical protein
MRILTLFLSLLLTSFSKDTPLKEPDGITFHASGKCLYFTNAVVKADPYGEKTLYSISSNNPSGDFLISVVATSLSPGVYKGGLNYWGSWLFSSNIYFRVISSENGQLTATFDGYETSGQIVRVQFKKPV